MQYCRIHGFYIQASGTTQTPLNNTAQNPDGPKQVVLTRPDASISAELESAFRDTETQNLTRRPAAHRDGAAAWRVVDGAPLEYAARLRQPHPTVAHRYTFRPTLAADHRAIYPEIIKAINPNKIREAPRLIRRSLHGSLVRVGTKSTLLQAETQCWPASLAEAAHWPPGPYGSGPMAPLFQVARIRRMRNQRHQST